MIGIDIAEIERVREKATSETFLKSVFTAKEIEYYNSRGKKAETLAGMFCAKEAVAKALGTGFRGFRPSDIEVTHNELGAPEAELYGGAKELAGKREVHISISHCKEYATAMCFIV